METETDLTCMAGRRYTVFMNESSNIKECDHLTDKFACGNDGIYYCTMCDKEWYKENDLLSDTFGFGEDIKLLNKLTVKND
jgi:hypothetical protein